MDENRARKWDLILRIAGMIGIAIGGGFTVWQYFRDREDRERTAFMEAQKPFLTQRQALYGDATRAVAQLATGSDPVEMKKAQDTFWLLYWGPLASVESKEVEKLMVQMGRCLQAADCTKPDKQQISLALAQQIRKESASSWRVELPDLSSR